MTMTSVISPYLVKYSLRLSVIIKRTSFIFQNFFSNQNFAFALASVEIMFHEYIDTFYVIDSLTLFLLILYVILVQLSPLN